MQGQYKCWNPVSLHPFAWSNWLTFYINWKACVSITSSS